MAEEVIRHETGPSVVMNCSSFSDSKHTYLVAGQESHCQLYNVKSVLVNDDYIETVGDEKSEVRNRKNSVKPQPDRNKNSKKLSFAIQAADSIQTDFSKNDPIQRVIRVSPDGKYMATGN